MHPKAGEKLRIVAELDEKLKNLDPSDREYGKTAKERASYDDFMRAHEAYEKLQASIAEAEEWIASKNPELDELAELAKEELPAQKIELERLDQEILLLLIPQDPMKDKSAIVEIRAGAGGDEAALFAGDLFRMYTRYAEKQRWKIDVISSSDLGIGGYKEIVFNVSGKGVYGALKLESGVHRVQRVPITESGGRVHTSTASVAVLPETDETDVTIDEKDLKIDVYRASGAGGQHVNKTESAVRITHLPSGLVVTCQDGRSQIQNKATAMMVLQSRLYDMEMQRRQNEESEKRKAQIGSGDRSEKIRTYNFQENRVTDHRIKLTLHKLDAILDGSLDELLTALKQSQDALLLEHLS
ncbi:bacterial peptide chain release factor 1 (bRF-1) [Brevinema andersonii]|uniref:Peptide chain release factor 1 n=1 Tax=Brevinema andersonii TaxID=34097 RepID=A0A1I1DAN1_BREAD|nr:peptide chain release factor 1 [Brevinema andersonii]SFB69880.1 bacterial peptide chain release factor 1 (bRF-1) [Brevinema andersonii]